MSKTNSNADQSLPEWLTGVGSETFEQQLAFRNWVQWSEPSRENEHQEIVKRGWLSCIRGEYNAAQ